MMWVIFPMSTMLIGFLMGICVMDTFYDNKRINLLEREIKRLKRMVEGELILKLDTGEMNGSCPAILQKS